jgi:hypothetical protein
MKTTTPGPAATKRGTERKESHQRFYNHSTQPPMSYLYTNIKQTNRKLPLNLLQPDVNQKPDEAQNRTMRVKLEAVSRRKKGDRKKEGEEELTSVEVREHVDHGIRTRQFKPIPQMDIYTVIPIPPILAEFQLKPA